MTSQIQVGWTRNRTIKASELLYKCKKFSSVFRVFFMALYAYKRSFTIWVTKSRRQVGQAWNTGKSHSWLANGLCNWKCLVQNSNTIYTKDLARLFLVRKIDFIKRIAFAGPTMSCFARSNTYPSIGGNLRGISTAKPDIVIS